MRLISKKIVSYLIACTFTVIAIFLPIPADADSYGVGYAHEPTGEAMLADALLIRPVMLTASVFTTATFIITMPLYVLGGNVGNAADELVLKPFAYTFLRPLGEI